ncbi:alpha-1,3-mannosyl-glycoprotein 4-beta-N-acetylglucosaminyltransferase C-like [Diadema setosum]|uniref:alpha-1,3-mannosyl-glycoprotein 4-beta-N-acetylglucosaminyltransferase C-like n=1 Tax=Diadema setosum TaxID=31175 RepID=UPI003B3A7514
MHTRFPAQEMLRDARMGRSRFVHKLLYAGVIVLCIVSCWNARLLYNSNDNNLSGKQADLMKKVVGQRDILLDTVSLLRQKCTDNKQLHGKNTTCNKPQLWTNPSNLDLEKALVLGYKREVPVFLTIGIPTVQRESETYFFGTLDSLIENTTPEERADLGILIFLADQEEEKRHTIKNALLDRYLKYLEDGFMQVIQAPPSFYPPLDKLKNNFGDTDDRVRWRAKQAVDFSFMFLYAQSLSDYYMQIEDDVVTTGGFVGAIREYIDMKRDVDWVTLEFSVLGFIGKLFHSSDLDRLAQFVMFFYEDQPIDFLYKYFYALNGQQDTHLRAPSLFQHMGMQSSLKDKKMDAKDRFFEPDERQFRGSDNPPGVVYSSMKAFSMYLPKLCYSRQPGFFWAVAPQEGDSVILVFDTPTPITRIAVTTGSTNHPADTLLEGSLELSPVLLQSSDADSLPQCGEYVEVGRFVAGQLDVGDVSDLFPRKVACVRILVLKSQGQWMAVRELAIWTPH